MTKDLRHLVDVTPWDGKGRSWMGLTRRSAKRLGLSFIVLGVALSDPPFGPLPTDFMNFWLAEKLMMLFDHWSYAWWVALTYTVIGWGLILFGIWIYPYHTRRLLNSYINKTRNKIKYVLNRPLLLIAAAALFLFMFHLYQTYFFGVI